nr:hypothetical protein [Tanacetum cinerariifolium]
MSLPTEVTAPLSNNNKVNKSTIVKSSLTNTNINTTNGDGISGISNAQTEGNNDAIVFNSVPNVLNIAEIFGVLFKTFTDIKDLMNGIEMGKHEAIWSGMTKERRKDVMDSMYTTWKRLTKENLSVASNVGNTTMDTSNDDTLHVDPIVHYVIIQEKPRSYVGVVYASKVEPSKSKANFRSLSFENLCEGAKFSIHRKVVKTVTTRFANTLYGYIIGLEDVLENGPWMIHNSPIIMKKWTMNTHLCKEELPVFRCGSRFMMFQYSFAWCLIKINANDVLNESLTMGVPLVDVSGFTIETISIKYEWKPPHCDLCKISGHVQDHFPKKVSASLTKKKGKSKSTNGGQSVKQTVRYKPKEITSVPKKRVFNLGNMSKAMSKNQPPKVIVPSSKEDNITMSNSYVSLDEESDEDVENVYDESANLFS